jgi:hypothetical protein
VNCTDRGRTLNNGNPTPVLFEVFPISILFAHAIDIESLQNRLLKFCYVPATSAGLPRVSFFFFFLLQWPFTQLIKQTRQAVHAIKQSIYSKMSIAHAKTFFFCPQQELLLCFHLKSDPN